MCRVLNRQVASAQAQRFRITHYQENDIREMLYLCYKAEVIKRGVEFLDDAQTKERLTKAAKWLCRECKPGLMLYGKIGSGKTTLARAIVQLIGVLYNSIYPDEKKYIYKVSSLDLGKDVTNEDKFGRIKREEMLFIDDVGIEPSTVKVYGNELSPMTEIIYSRYDSRKLTIVTSNLRGDEFRQRYGDRIGDRLLEMFDTIEFNQTLSYRR